MPSATSPGCGYTPPEIQTAYNLTGLYNEGYDGTGQTIAIVDWCGSVSIRSDANEFSTKFGLPKLTSSNFAITYTAHSECIAYDQVEINLDVEWAHAVAPGANINLVVPPSASFQDVDEAEFDVANYGLGNVLSGSYGSPEALTAATELDTENLISEIGAAAGISFNFASGDEGTFALTDGVFLPTVSAPADSPWSTAVGGVTLALNFDNSIAWQAGWGNNGSLLAAGGDGVRSARRQASSSPRAVVRATASPSTLNFADRSVPAAFPSRRTSNYWCRASIANFPTSPGWRIPSLEP